MRSPSWRVVLPILMVAVAGCVGESADDESSASPDETPAVHADGERGVGTFDTLWGVETLDFEWMDGRMVHDGDIVLDPESQIGTPGDAPDGFGESTQGLLKAAAKWEMVNGIVKVPYSFASDVSAARREKIRTAMDEWESEIGFLRFVQSSATTGRRVKFVKWDKSFCLVNGSNTGEVKVYTSADCGWITYVHELGHVLGFRHEQKRIDRATYVKYEKERTCKPSEFSPDDAQEIGTYDTNSIMHYPSCMFANSTSSCGGTSGCSSQTPNKWVLTRKPAYGTPYIPWWEQRNKGEVIKSGDKCNFKSLYGFACDASSPSCKPKTCESLGKDCGVIDDDCGGTVSCGGCDAGETCGGGGTPNVCDTADANPFPVAGWTTGTMQSGEVCIGVAGGSSTNGAEIRTATCSSDALHQNWHMTSRRQWKNDKSDKCATVSSISSGAGVTQATCVEGDERQMWRLREMEIVHGKTGRCLTVPHGDYQDGQSVIIRPCEGKAKQEFAYRPATYEIRAGGWCLDAQTSSGVISGNDVSLRECDGSASQQWDDTRGGFVSRATPALCMAIEGGPDAADGSRIQVSGCNDTVGQMWGLRGDLQHWHDNYCLTQHGAGEDVSLDVCDGSAAQLFTKWSQP